DGVGRCVRDQCAIVAGIPSTGPFALRSFPACTGNSARSQAVSRNARSYSRASRPRTADANRVVVEGVGGGSACSWRRSLERARSRCQPGSTYVRKGPAEGMRATDRRTETLFQLRVRITQRDSPIEHRPIRCRIESIMDEIPSTLELIP